MNNSIAKIVKYITDDKYRFVLNNNFGLYRHMDDEEYLKRMFYCCHGYYPDLKNPKTFSEKLQWLKLHDRKDYYPLMVDKYEAKKTVGKIIGEDYIIPSLGIYEHFDNIDFNTLPDQFVIKCTHDSGGLVICDNKKSFDISGARRKISGHFKNNYYYLGREWPYKNVSPRILIEKYMSDGSTSLSDYKIHVFNGKARLILVCRDRFESTGLTEDFFDENWNHLELRRPKHPNASKIPNRPSDLELMIKLAERIAVDIPFVRVDFYVIEKKVFFGEVTFYPASGYIPFEPTSWDEKMGNWLELPEL